eukprot:scaffold298237_cov28-Tisochrysis_lutea.AAC.2
MSLPMRRSLAWLARVRTLEMRWGRRVGALLQRLSGLSSTTQLHIATAFRTAMMRLLVRFLLQQCVYHWANLAYHLLAANGCRARGGGAQRFMHAGLRVPSILQ